MSKAFEVTWITGLLFKLASVGISGCLLKWFQSFLLAALSQFTSVISLYNIERSI